MIFENSFVGETGEVSLKLIEERDADLMYKWLNDEEVLEFYEGRDNPFSRKMIKNKFFNGDKRKIKYIIEYSGEPVGYIQSYALSKDECTCEYEFICSEDDMPVYGIDLFIGEPRYWSHGIGRKALKLLFRLLVHEHGVRTFLLDPHCDNERAIKCYTACGFVPVKILKEHEMHEGKMCDCLIMKYTV